MPGIKGQPWRASAPPVILLALALATTSVPAHATSLDASAALDRFRVGLAALETGDLRLAAVAFDEAHARHPHPALVYNAGLAYDRAGDGGVARARYERYVSAPTADPRFEVLARRRLQSLPPTDGPGLAQEALLPLLRQLRERLRRLAPLGPDASLNVHYVSGVAAPDHAEGAGPRLATLGWVGAGIGAVVMVIGGVLRIDGDNIAARLATVDRRPDGVVVSPSQADAHRWAGEASRQINSSTVTLSVGGGLLAVGVLLLVMDLTAQPGEETALSLPTPVLDPRLGGASFGLGGRF